MKMNKKGQKIFYGIMVAIILFIAIVQLIKPIKDQVTDIRGEDKLNCTGTSLSTGEKATCILVDWWLFYFVGTAFTVAISYVTFKNFKDDK